MTEVVVDNGKAFVSEESATIATEAAAQAKQWAEESERQANIATSNADTAVDAKDDAIAAKNLAQDWAVKMDGMVNNEDYSSKYYASQSAGSASSAQTHKNNAQIWAEGTDAQVQGLGGEHSAKGWAQQESSNYSVTATGTTTSRTLKDRFADIVNVKDFGAKGDGTTDDTAAFEAAVLTGKKIFVPKGSYKITRSFNSDFYSDEELTFTNIKQYVKCLKFSQESGRKDIIHSENYYFPEYDDVFNIISQEISNLTLLGVQGAAVNIKNNETYLYIYRMSIVNGSTFTDTINTITVHNLTKGQYLGYYTLRGSKGQSIYVKTEADGDYLYVSNNAVLKRYKITGAYGSELTSSNIGNENVPCNSFFSYYNGEWIVETKTAVESNGTYYSFAIYDESFNFKRGLYVPKYLYETGVSSTVPDLDDTASFDLTVPHTQDIALNKDGVLWFKGGDAFYDGHSGYGDNGVIVSGLDGSLIKSSLLDCHKYRDKIVELLGGVTGTPAIECEGGFIMPDGRICSMLICNRRGDGLSVNIIDEFSDSATSFDCSQMYSNISNIPYNINLPNYQKYKSSGYVDCITGKALTTYDDILTMMKNASIDNLRIDAGNGGIYTLNGASVVPSNENARFAEIKKVRGRQYQLTLYDTFDVYSQHPNRITKRYHINTDADGNITAVLKKGEEFASVVIDGNDNAVSNSSNPELVLKGKQSGFIFWQSNNNNQSKIASVININDDGTNRIYDLGVASTYELPTMIRGFVGSYGATTFSQGIVLNTSFFGSWNNNSLTLGNATHLWKEIFAANATINTSDERQKQNISNIDERVFRAWDKVEFKQFIFKDAFEQKGENARIHIGLIAQRVKEAFESEGLDGFKYGLLCYDEWEDEYENVEVIDKEAEYDEDGNETVPAKTHTEKKIIQKAGNAYGIRYNEALALECAYQRWKLEQMQKQLDKILNKDYSDNELTL